MGKFTSNFPNLTSIEIPPCERNTLVLQQQQNLWRRFVTCKMHLSPPPVAFVAVGSFVVDSLLIVTPIVGSVNSKNHSQYI